MFFLPDLTGGGAERVMAILAGEIAGRGIDLDLVLAMRGGVHSRSLHPSIRVTELRKRRCMSAVIPLAALLRKRRPDVLVVTLNHANVAATLACLIAGTRTPLFLREANAISSSARDVSRLSGVVLGRLTAFSYRRAAGVMGNSAGLVKELITHFHLHSSKVHLLPNAVFAAPEAYRECDIRPAAAEKLIVAIGRLAPQKNFACLLRAFGEGAPHDARLAILGEGPERVRLESLVKQLGLQGRVSLPGFCEDPIAVVRTATAFVLSSNYEGCPSALIQALAAGAPCIATDCQWGPRELLSQANCGRLVPVGDGQALGEAIAAAFRGQITAASAEARRAIVRRYSAGAVADRLLEILRIPAGQSMDGACAR